MNFNPLEVHRVSKLTKPKFTKIKSLDQGKGSRYRSKKAQNRNREKGGEQSSNFPKHKIRNVKEKAGPSDHMDCGPLI
jgi:hypothetical protein